MIAGAGCTSSQLLLTANIPELPNKVLPVSLAMMASKADDRHGDVPTILKYWQICHLIHGLLD